MDLNIKFHVGEKVILRGGRASYKDPEYPKAVMECSDVCEVVGVCRAKGEDAKYHDQMVGISLPSGYELKEIIVSGADLIKQEDAE